ncbi:hypothetical protein PTKIN_Ptkin16aG0499300 [Pterospermum kingtungense]
MVNLLWGSKGEIEVKPTRQNLFLVKFPCSDLRDKVLETRPWHIQNRPLIIRKWESRLQALDFDLKKIPVWIHLSNVPLELFTRRGLSYIASVLGVPLYMDRFTASQQRLAFAKVCVELDASKEIPKEIKVEMKDGHLVYVQKTSNDAEPNETGKEVPSEAKIQDQAEKTNEVGESRGKIISEKSSQGKLGKGTSNIGNRFEVPSEVADQQDCSLSTQECCSSTQKGITMEEALNDARKPRVVAAGVAELIKTIQPKKKNNAGKKVARGGLGGNSTTPHNANPNMECERAKLLS